MRVETIGDATQRLTAIYALCDPDNSPRYVGKTVRYLHERHKAHISAAKRNPRLPVHRWIRKRMDANQPLVIWLLEYVAPGDDWAARERFWIKRFRDRGDDILNLTEGGEGLAGHKFSQTHRNNIAAGLRTGATFSCEACSAEFWRKRKDIIKGNCRFCSRACYAASLRGVHRPVSAIFHERGIAASALAKRAQVNCKRGHPLSGDNLFLTSSGARGCKLCRKLHKLKYRARVAEPSQKPKQQSFLDGAA